MEHTTFLDHYRVRTNEDDAPQEVSRTGSAINYQAVDTRSHETVALQLVPLAAIDSEKRAQLEERARTAQKLDHVNIAKILDAGVDHEYFCLVSEHLEGETTETWVVTHGPMLSDAVLRVGLQVLRAIGAATFFGLTHRSIQPSNILILSGQSPDGGWPFVKVLNFGLAGAELHSESEPAHEIAPSAAPEFASPEQRLNREIDFRSEMYSLGATICFLLTGAAPLAISGMRARLRLRRLPEFRHAPRPMRNLLVSLLRENPANRPLDPVLFEARMRDCLSSVERRYAIRRKLGIPLAAVVPQKSETSRTVFGQIWRGALAALVLLVAATAAAGYLFPGYVPLFHHSGEIGVPVGVADVNPQSRPPANSSPAATAPVNSNQVAKNESLNAQSSVAPSGEPSPVAAPSAPATTVASAVEPAPPAAGPVEQLNTRQNQTTPEQSSSQSDVESDAAPKRAIPSTAKTKTSSRSARIAEARANEDRVLARATHRGFARARLVGRTADGRMILRLPSGRTVLLRPRGEAEDDAFLPRPRRRFMEESDAVAPQPFNPPGYPND